MPRRKTSPPSQPTDAPIADYRHAARRKNNPPALLASQGRVQEAPRTRYAYDPHLPPVLRFDDTGASDRLPELLTVARTRPLTAEEARLLADALRSRQPWLEWTGKREKPWFEVDPLALHIHERVSAQAVIKLAARQPLQRSLFADPELDYRQAVQFYQHDVDWANRLILGDSLTVMHSLARREDLAGKVQMIYIDPPYGIKYASNFQSEVSKRDVKDNEASITREPEQIKAYRDTWTLGIHSYLTYLRERLTLARELLTDRGSIFVQISVENLHRVRTVMDEVFGPENFFGIITYATTTSQTSTGLSTITDYLIWYAKDRSIVKFNQPFVTKDPDEAVRNTYQKYELANGEIRNLRSKEIRNPDLRPTDGKILAFDNMTSRSGSESTTKPFSYQNTMFTIKVGGWKTNEAGMIRLANAERLEAKGAALLYRRYFDDFPYAPLSTLWEDTQLGGFVKEETKIFVVQTPQKVIQRCLLMTTDPGDLVLDPTCGSGTTAYVAEQWGRRWITIDTSRVALALARQRLLTAKYDYYQLADPAVGPSAGFVYQTVPHITLKSIAQNQALDPIFARWEPVLAARLAALNAALAAVTPELRASLQRKLVEKERRDGKSSITDADRRRWLLPKDRWEHWQVPFDTDPEYPAALQTAVSEYRQAWRARMDEVNAAIAVSAPQETLVDKPKLTSNILRVAGPFTVEGVQPIEETLDTNAAPIDEPDSDLDTFPAAAQVEPTNADAYMTQMISLLRGDGVRFPDNKAMAFSRLDRLNHTILHAEGEWAPSPRLPGEGAGGEVSRRAAVRFGPQYGPLTAQMVEDAIWAASRAGYDDLLFAALAIDAAAQAVIQDDPNPRVRCHLAHIRPDVTMGDLLKDTPSSQLFTVFGLPRVELRPARNGEYIVEMQGVDIYNPVDNTLRSTGAEKVAAWFLDSDYDGRTFCITQAFFPDSAAWEKLARALKTTVDPDRFAAFSGTVSLPFAQGKHGKIAVKVIDPRGNEVIRVMNLE